MVKRPGKKLEGELNAALKHLDCFDYNPNDFTPCGDRIVHWEGRGILVECKETRDGQLPFSRFEGKNGNERRMLNWHAGLPNPKDDYPAPRTAPHGLTVVLVMLVCARPRVWAARWEDVHEMEFAPGALKHLKFPPSDPRWVEVVKVQRAHSLGWTWDLGPVLRRWVVNVLPPAGDSVTVETT